VTADNALNAEPGAAQDQNVGPAVVVVIGLHDVQPPISTGRQSGLHDLPRSACATSCAISTTTATGLHDRTQEFRLVGETGGLNIMQTDYNNDGWPDVLVLRGAWFGVEGHYPLFTASQQRQRHV